MSSRSKPDDAVSTALQKARALLGDAGAAGDPRLTPVLKELDRAIAGDAGGAKGASSSGDDENRDRFLAAVCHDLKDPLAAVLMGAAFLLRTTPTEPEASRTRRMIEAIIRSGERMNGLVRNLVDFTKLQRGNLDIEPREHPVGPLLESAIEELRVVAKLKDVAIAAQADDTSAAHILCDAERFRQIVQLIGGNALRYAPTGSAITVRAERAQDFARFAIIDSGPGISPGLLAHIFDPYWLARQSPRDGTGLGIAVAKGIVEAHGGTVAIDSDPGKGTTFTFTLPLTTSEATS